MQKITVLVLFILCKIPNSTGKFTLTMKTESEKSVDMINHEVLNLIEALCQETYLDFTFVFHAERNMPHFESIFLKRFKFPLVMVEAVLHDDTLLLNSTVPNFTDSDVVHVIFLNSYKIELLTLQSVAKLLVVNLSNNSMLNILKSPSLNQIPKVSLLQYSKDKQHVIISTTIPFSKETSKIYSVQLLKREKLSLDKIFGERFLNFNGHVFHIASSATDAPYMYYAGDRMSPPIDGVAVEMLNTLGRSLNFSYTLTEEALDYEWGSFENGSWTGMLGMIANDNYDFTVNYFTLTAERYSAFDSSVTYWQEGFGLFLLLPRPLPKWKNLYNPFSGQVWLIVLMLVIVMSAFFEIQACSRIY